MKLIYCSGLDMGADIMNCLSFQDHAPPTTLAAATTANFSYIANNKNHLLA
jgi:hypothetical protein